MRRHAVIGILAGAVMAFIWYSSCLAETLQSQAMNSLQEAVVKALPVDRKMSRMAVLDFKGDNNMVKNGIVSAIKERTSCKVMERADFDRVLAEQGLQLKDIMDGNTRVRHGRLKGVQGFLTGDVYRSRAGFMSYHVKAHVKLVDVEKGEIVLSRDFEVSAVSPLRKYVIWGIPAAALLLVLCLLLFLNLKRGRRSGGARIFEGVGGNRKGVTGEIDKIIVHVSEAKSRLVETGQTRVAVELKDIERNLMEMKRSVAKAPPGGAGLDSRRGSSGAVCFDMEIFWKLEDLERLSERICRMASSPCPDDVGPEIGALRAGVLKVDGDLKLRRVQY